MSSDAIYSAITCLLLIAELIQSSPTCEQKNTDIVCVPGKTDYNLTRGLVSDHDDITGITLRGCRIIYVEYESFENLPALEYLDLSKNKINHLKLGVLDGFHQLTFLNLSFNKISGFPLGLFDQKPNLLILDLKGNQINNLELGILDPVTKLEHFDVSSNKLVGKNLNTYIFDQSPHIKFMDFSRNDISEAPDSLLQSFQDLQFLNLDRCFLKKFPKFAIAQNLKSMQHLMVSTNKLSRLDDGTVFVQLTNLEIINLADNVIDMIVNDIFMPLKKLKMVVLRGNQLTQIPDTLFQNLPKLINVDLSRNNIEYVPVNAFRGSPVKNLNLAVNKFTYLTDNFCLELKNSGGMLTKFFFNQNPWQCACLRDILVEVKSLGIQYNTVKLDGKSPVCVTHNEFTCKRQPSDNAHFYDLYNDVIVSPS